MTDADKVLSGMFTPRDRVQGSKAFTSHDDLQAYYGPPAEIGLRMHIDYLHENYQTFIRRSPFLVIGTSGKDGMPSVSPKGDAPGFVAIIDEKTLAIPDRPGNNQVDTLHNLLENPQISLIFFVPGVNETLRIKGAAEITTDEALRARMAMRGKLPPAVLKVSVRKAYLHCGKALIRAQLWDSATQAKKGEVPSIAKMTLDMEHNKDLPGTVEEWDRRAEEVYRTTLY